MTIYFILGLLMVTNEIIFFFIKIFKNLFLSKNIHINIIQNNKNE